MEAYITAYLDFLADKGNVLVGTDFDKAKSRLIEALQERENLYEAMGTPRPPMPTPTAASN